MPATRRQRRRRSCLMSSDLHGNAPDNSSVVLLLVDVINDLEFPGGDVLARHALPAAKNIAALKDKATRAGILTIYVNDNFGKWRSDFRTLVSHCIENPNATCQSCR